MTWIVEHLDTIFDILLIIAGLSAFLVYFAQKRAELYSAGTLIVGQVALVEKNVSALKNDHQLGNIVVYHSNPIIKENMWERYKHLFVKKLTNAEYELVQRFFDQAEQIERARLDIIRTIANGWSDKSSAEHMEVAQIIRDMIDTNSVADRKIEQFRTLYRPLDLVFTPDIVIQSLTKGLHNFSEISGTVAYSKIRKRSYSK